MRSAVLASLALVLLSACAPKYSHWENAKYPRPLSEEHKLVLDRDKYECQRENTYSSAYVDRYSGTSGAAINYDLALACMKARGWYLVPK